MTSDLANVSAVWPIARITIGDRTRKKLGDIDSLMRSIEAVGLLHPVVVRSDGHLVAGFRRLKALERLGFVETEVTIANTVDDELLALTAERDENTCREPFTTAEVHTIASRLLKLERPAAKKRQQEHGGTAPGRKSTSGESPEVNGATGRKPEAMERVAAAVGVGRKKLEQIEAVHKAAEETPALASVLASMESEDKVLPAFEIATEWTAGQRKELAKLWQWGWENSQIVKFAKALDRIPDEERSQARALVIGDAATLTPKLGIQTMDNVAGMPAKKRAKLYELHASDDRRDRDAAISMASGNPPAPDPRLAPVIMMTQDLKRFAKLWPDEPASKNMLRAAELLGKVAEELRTAMADRTQT